jgi:hypothetical protein
MIYEPRAYTPVATVEPLLRSYISGFMAFAILFQAFDKGYEPSLTILTTTIQKIEAYR